MKRGRIVCKSPVQKPKPDTKRAARIVKAIGLAKILTAYEEANRALPPKILREFRVAVGLAANPQADNSRRLTRIAKVPFEERHRLFHDFWEEFHDFKLEPKDLYSESPEWLQRVADEVMSECDWDV